MSAELPPADTARWVIRRKAAVVAAVGNGRISLEEACSRYSLSRQEFIEWSVVVRRWLARPMFAHEWANRRATPRGK